MPAQFRVLVVRRPKYACRACEDVVVQAPAPARLIEGGLPTEATVAQVLVSKYADHFRSTARPRSTPARAINLDRSTLADWVGRAAFLLRPVHERLLTTLKARPSCSPTRRRRRCSILAAAEPRPASSGPMPATIDLGAAPIRPAWSMSMRPTARPSGRSRILPASAACCRSTAMAAIARWPNAARCSSPSAGPMSAAASTNSPPPARRRSPARRWSASPALYAIESEIRGRTAEERRAVRQEKSRPIIEALEPWLRAKLGLISQKTKLAEAIRYALSRWEGLTRFLDDGRVEIDSNIVERAIRPIALNRKNALFAGSDGGGEHWAIIASLIETCKLNDVDPQAYLADVITRIVNGHPNSRIDELLPWAYRRSPPSKPWPENSAYGATVLDCAATTGGSPVAMQDHAFVLGCKGIGELLACGTNVNVLISHITEVLLAEASFRLCVRGHRLGQCNRDASLLACQDLFAVEVTTVGDGIELLDA